MTILIIPIKAVETNNLRSAGGSKRDKAHRCAPSALSILEFISESRLERRNWSRISFSLSFVRVHSPIRLAVAKRFPAGKTGVGRRADSGGAVRDNGDRVSELSRHRKYDQE
jgi:hypothetical protein